MDELDESFDIKFNTAQDIIDNFAYQLNQFQIELRGSNLGEKRDKIQSNCLDMIDSQRVQYCNDVYELKILERKMGGYYANYISFDICIKILKRAIRLMGEDATAIEHLKYALESLSQDDTYKEVHAMYMDNSDEYSINIAPSVHYIILYTKSVLLYLLKRLEIEKRMQQLVD